MPLRRKAVGSALRSTPPLPATIRLESLQSPNGVRPSWLARSRAASARGCGVKAEGGGGGGSPGRDLYVFPFPTGGVTWLVANHPGNKIQFTNRKKQKLKIPWKSNLKPPQPTKQKNQPNPHTHTHTTHHTTATRSLELLVATLPLDFFREERGR